MLRGGDVKAIRDLHRSGLSQQEIQHETGFDPKTIRKYLADPKLPLPHSKRSSLLDPFKGYLDQRMDQGVWNATTLLRELKSQGFEGQYTIVREYLATRRHAAKEIAVRRFETPPGDQAQVDWGKVGTLEVVCAEGDVRRHSLWGFVMTLGYSRAAFYDIALDQTMGTLLGLHEDAFRFLGGLPQEIVYDNMATVVNIKGCVRGLDDRGEIDWNPTFREFSRYWGFRPHLCQPYRPQTKGKCENGIGYLQKSFVMGCAAADLVEMRNELRTWLEEVALARVHGTTHRIVREAWEEEKPFLVPVGERIGYRYEPLETRRVSRDAFIHYETNRYSVPWRLAGREVSLGVSQGQLLLYHGGARVAHHERSLQRHQVIVDPAHHAGLPWGTHGRPHKPQVTLSTKVDPASPIVERRDLSVYEALVGRETLMGGVG